MGGIILYIIDIIYDISDENIITVKLKYKSDYDYDEFDIIIYDNTCEYI